MKLQITSKINGSSALIQILGGTTRTLILKILPLFITESGLFWWASLPNC